MNYFTNLMSKFNNYKSRVDFFPSTYLRSRDLFDEIVDKDIPYIEEYQSMISEDDEDEDIDSLLRGEDLVKNIRAEHLLKTCKEDPKEGSEGKDTAENSTEEETPAKEVTETTAAATVQSDLNRFLKHQESGLETSYRCIRCRGCPQCLKGAGQENISIRMELEQELIRESIKIDEKLNRAVATLPFITDPKGKLCGNQNVADK